MWTIRGEWIIGQLVDQFLNREYSAITDMGKSEKYPGYRVYRRPGLAFKLRMRVDEYSNEEDTRSGIDNALVLFCSNTSVFYITESEVVEILENRKTIRQKYKQMQSNNIIHEHKLKRKLRYIDRVLKSDIKKMPIFEPTTMDPEWWINSSNHDSCWRSDGFSWLSERYFDMCYQVRSSEEVAPAALSTDLDFGFGKVFEHVYIHTISDPEDEGSWQRIIKVERIK